MTNPPGELVFDTGPLNHFAKQGWLAMLRAVLAGRRAVIPDTVLAELREGAHAHPHLHQVLDASWIHAHELSTIDELRHFATFSSLLVARGRNRGEAGVLAYAKAHQALAIIDDGAGRKAAQAHGVSCQGTLALLCQALREELLTIKLISVVADDLLEGEYRLPFVPGGFEEWARDNGLVPPGA